MTEDWSKWSDFTLKTRTCFLFLWPHSCFEHKLTSFWPVHSELVIFLLQSMYLDLRMFVLHKESVMFSRRVREGDSCLFGPHAVNHGWHSFDSASSFAMTARAVSALHSFCSHTPASSAAAPRSDWRRWCRWFHGSRLQHAASLKNSSGRERGDATHAESQTRSRSTLSVDHPSVHDSSHDAVVQIVHLQSDSLSTQFQRFTSSF